ncbi:hypothetical protein [Dyella humicola]|uniref:hypothetical protein n=1 Tax=Dyella humicola TaxID=2992126 RepID=UPI00225C1460|nr:hypothetical protein [Dyella humicola]
MIAFAVGTIAIVGMVGTLVAYKLLRHDDAAAVASTTTMEASAAAVVPESARSAPSTPKSNDLASIAATPASANSTPAAVTTQAMPQPGSSMVVLAQPTLLPRDESVQAVTSAPGAAPQQTTVEVEQPRPDSVANQRAAPLPVRAANDQQTPAPTPRKDERSHVPADALAASQVQDIALNLVRKGEIAFFRQDYSTAIANAKAALEVKPGLARAQNLLDEAQRAQQQAMNSISIQ